VNLAAAAASQLMDTLGVEKNRVKLVTITPQLIAVEAYLRNEKGLFYVDPEKPDEAASETLVFGMEW